MERLIDWLRRQTAEAWVTLALVAFSVVFVFLQLEPHLIFANTTPAGGDMGAHVWAPDFLHHELLPRWRLSGWTPDWYDGFPAFQFYMVIPSLLIVLLDVFLFLPYGVAFKIVTVSGLVAMPVAAWAMGRMARLPYPTPAALAVATVPFIFDRSFTIYGGNAASTLAGEFAFTISLVFALLFIGVVLRGIETGRHRALAAVLLALTVTCHLIPAIFAVIAGVVALGMSWDWRELIENRWDGNRLRAAWIGTVLGVGTLLSAFWTVPFLLRRAYLTDMGWEKITYYATMLFPGHLGEQLSRLAGSLTHHDYTKSAATGDMTWVIALAIIGVGTSIFFRRRFGIFLIFTGLALVVAVIVTPQSRLWNARLLPFWYLCLYFLAALAVVELITAVAVLVARVDDAPDRLTVIGGTVLAALVAFWAVALPLRVLPFGHQSTDGSTYSWLFVKTKDKHFIHDWATWNYSGYERKKAYPEYKAVIDLMDDLSKRNGCGRAMWEYDKSEDRFGTPMALMLLPYWTNHCVGSMEGLYFEASATTPYHFLNQSELSLAPSRAQRDLPYESLNVSRGVDHLQLMGVKYYLAFSSEAVAQADADKDLTPLATTAEYVNPNTGQKVRWHVYKVAHSEMVQPLVYQPAVVKDWGKGTKDWQKMAVDWYVNRSRWNVVLADHGPSAWQRVRPNETPDKKTVSPTTVTHIKSGIDTISFHVDRPGVPVLVKASYFPNWKVSGAKGPYRVAPNLMVVVPTKNVVRLHYGRTAVDWFSYLLTWIGIALVVVLARAGRLSIPPRVVRTPPLQPEPPFGEEELVTAGTGPSPGDRWAAPPESSGPGSDPGP